MSSFVSITSLLFANILTPVGLLIFATGFFPYKPFLPGIATFDHVSNNERIVPLFDKVIFMVIDALRSDFVYSHNSGFAFTQSLIRSGEAIPFTAHATSPTITMPRIKAITTGSIPSFLDVILNFAESDTTSNLTYQDNWLAQLKAKKGGKLVMYGDDTWLKLFPEVFSRKEGTSSFFVSDFTEVDNNVTRHIPGELKQDDWNGMILHYLGLDHIGHKSGPRSPNMIPKQHEMDRIVKQIYEAIESEKHLQSTLLVLCGDHGMNDAGNHGGSAEGETSTALVFLSSKLKPISKNPQCPQALPEGGFQYYDMVEQSDITPTLAGLLGFPIPLNNLGVFISNFLPLWSEEKQAEIMLQNALQIRSIVKEVSIDMESRNGTDLDCGEAGSEAGVMDCKWSKVSAILETMGRQSRSKWLRATIEFSRFAQAHLSKSASKYDLSRLYCGICVVLIAVTAAIVPFAMRMGYSKPALFCICFLGLLYGIMMFASSYVEEEQYFWYWVASSWCGWLFFRGTGAKNGVVHGDFPSLILLLLVRVLRRWNQTGQKHAGASDISQQILPNHTFSLWFLVVVTYLDIARRLTGAKFSVLPRNISFPVFATLCLAALIFKAAFTHADAPELLFGIPQPLIGLLGKISLVVQSRLLFLGIGTAVCLAIFTKIFHTRTSNKGNSTTISTHLHDLLALFLITQSRLTNIPLFLLFNTFYHVLAAIDATVTEITLTSLILQYTSFFAFGGSNAISSIDLSNSYNGVDTYRVMAVAILVFCSNWAGPLWWMSATMMLLLRKRELGEEHVLRRHLLLLTVFNAASVLAIMLACTALRTHLFIWSVFSPKYLYSIAWSVGQHLFANVLFGGFLFWIGTV